MRFDRLVRVHALARELDELLYSAGLARADSYPHHGDTSCLLHSIAVALLAMRLLDTLHISCDRRALVRGALLHDFFLYDWHIHARETGRRLHAFRHPAEALENARRATSLTPIEENIIARHMFPVTPVPPACREALAVCAADKLCALYESFHRRGCYPELRHLFGPRISRYKDFP